MRLNSLLRLGSKEEFIKKENKSFIEVVVKSKEKTQKGLQHVS